MVAMLHVAVESTFGREPFVAHRTEIRFLSGMDPAVHFHVILDPECFVTKITFKWSLSGMHSDVVVEGMLLTKRLAADFSVRTVISLLFL